MLPEINFFGSPLNVYGLCAAIGLIAMGAVAFILGQKTKKILLEDVLFGEVFMLIGAFIGSHLLYGITQIPKINEALEPFFKEKWDTHVIFDVIFFCMRGTVYYGGLILGIVFGLLYCKFRKLDFKNFSDCFAVGIPLFHAIARIGCFCKGCCFGIESGFGFVTDSTEGITRFPVQLLESAINIAIFVGLLIIFRKGIMKGQLIYAYLLTYATLRFFVEFLRGDYEARGFLLFLSTSQWISIILIAFAAYKLFGKKLLKKKKKEAD